MGTYIMYLSPTCLTINIQHLNAGRGGEGGTLLVMTEYDRFTLSRFSDNSIGAKVEYFYNRITFDPDLPENNFFRTGKPAVVWRDER